MRILLGAYLAAMLLRACVFDAYRIPSASMEQTLQPGDFVFVSKIGYGARIPEAKRIPFTRRIVTNPILPGARLPGLGGPQRDDVVVFRYPPEAGPVATKTPYVKRLIGLPGDIVEIRSKEIIVNSDTLAYPENGRQLWIALLDDGIALPPDTLAKVGAVGRFERISDRERLVEGTAAVAQSLRQVQGVEGVLPLVRRPGDGSAGFPPSANYSLDDWGPLRVPSQGWTIPLNGETWLHYRDTIYKHEPAEVVRVAGGFERDGQPVESYTFSQDYFLAFGDNRDDSADSRSWGFIPESHLIGRAKLVYFSRDPETGSFRWDRFFHGVR
ncbi:MAG: signal peptidase I [Bacteroidota bacterium]